MDERRQVLNFENVTLSSDEYGGIDPVAITLELSGADLLLLLVEHPGHSAAFADVCAGLLMPSAGVVRFLSKDWRGLKPDTANALRGRIGRAFATGNWIHSLGLLENTLLQQLHHTRIPFEYHLEEASRLARRIGLPGIPLGFPKEFSAADLQQAALVRAFLGKPALILLEEPTRHLNHDTRARLINLIREARDDGTTVIWITADHHLWRNRSIPATRHYRWLGRELMEVHQK